MVKLIVGENDLQTWCHENNRTDLIDEWDKELNKPYMPTDFTHGSNVKANWICSKCGRKWTARIANRTKKDNPRGCKVCGRKTSAQSCRETAIARGGSFRDWCEKNMKTSLLNEWNHELNLPDTPETISWGGTRNYYWWNCSLCGEVYQSRLDHRRKGMGHRYCKSSSYHNSDAEIGILYYIQLALGEENVIATYSDPENGISEIDIYIPAKKIGIEYDGEGYHASSSDKDIKKDKACGAAGITLYRIREPGCPQINSTSICIQRERTGFNSDYDNAIKTLLFMLGIEVNVDSVRDQGQIIALRGRQINEKSLQAKFPKIAEEWDYVENDPLTPNMVSYGAERDVAWICGNCGNKYRMLVYSRTGAKRHGCPVCGERKRSFARHRAVNQYSPNGEFVAQFPSVSDAAKYALVSPTSISACCTGRYKTSAGYIWRYVEDEKSVVPLSPHVMPKRYNKPVQQYSLSGKLIKEYETLVDAEQQTGVKASNIHRNAIGERKSASGFMWKYSADQREISEYRIHSHKARQICQLTILGEYISSFPSILAAEKATGIHESSIRDCCNGKVKTAGGFIWRNKEI